MLYSVHTRAMYTLLMHAYRNMQIWSGHRKSEFSNQKIPREINAGRPKTLSSIQVVACSMAAYSSEWFHEHHLIIEHPKGLSRSRMSALVLPILISYAQNCIKGRQESPHIPHETRLFLIVRLQAITAWLASVSLIAAGVMNLITRQNAFVTPDNHGPILGIITLFLMVMLILAVIIRLTFKFLIRRILTIEDGLVAFTMVIIACNLY